ncbi:MAG: hypothetical protein KDC24_09335, partial [Saprospiraceae bacterium]|nr:hypothetical protein [Saprospiraceae bacterium]
MPGLRLFLFLLFFFPIVGYSQIGCPGCIIDLPSTLPADTVFLQDAVTGFENLPYESNVSFRLPKSTTPVSILDPSVPGGLTIDRITISGLSNLPAGLSWEINQTDFRPADQTDGCVLICGTPTEIGYFLVEVNLTAVVFGIQQNSAFTFPIQIYPEPSTDEPVVLFGNSGCDSLEVTIVNNLPSNGLPGYSYQWDFGDGRMDTSEFPGPIAYNLPGQYFVNFKAFIDTAGFTLSAVKVLEAGCSDFGIPPIISGNPDLYFLLKDLDGNEVYRSDVVGDASIPTTFGSTFLLVDTAYVLEVWDDDSGLAGGDDLCGRVQLNRNQIDTLVDGSLKVSTTIFHPVLEVIDQDTVIVFESPERPDIFPDEIYLNCKDTFYIEGDNGKFLTWYREGLVVGTGHNIAVLEPGFYWAVDVDTSGTCFVNSDSVFCFPREFPPDPIFNNDNNLLYIPDSIAFSQYTVAQWYFNTEEIPDAIYFSLCATQSGSYTIVVTDTLTGCSSNFEASIAFNPNYDCLSGTEEAGIFDLKIYPNPVVDELIIEDFSFGETDRVMIFDAVGIMVWSRTGFKHGSKIDVSS